MTPSGIETATFRPPRVLYIYIVTHVKNILKFRTTNVEHSVYHFTGIFTAATYYNA